MRLIDADALKKELAISGSCNNCAYEGIFGCREDIRVADVCYYIRVAPTVEAIPVEWIEKYEKYDDLAASIYRMLEAWSAGLPDYEDWVKVNK